ncbi:MAG: hypothetical protein J0M16_07120 [Gammaproteobacteria bacterium]|jgi:hypothetical protein|nr:hypothetical protein [Gammaproteobacteria bacterium]
MTRLGFRGFLRVIVPAMLLLGQAAHAATEYLRFQGTVHANYAGVPPSYCCASPDPTITLQGGQSVWFDFSINTGAQPAGRADTTYQDYFVANYLQGSINPPLTSVGLTTSFPEGVTTWLRANSLFVGVNWNALNSFQPLSNSRSIATWAVGTPIDLMQFSYFSYNVIGTLTLTYRGSTALAPIPVPASLWLFSGAIGTLAFARRRVSARPC